MCVDHATQYDTDGVQTSDKIIIPTKYKIDKTVVSLSESGQTPNTQTTSTETTQTQSSQSQSSQSQSQEWQPQLSKAEKKAAKAARRAASRSGNGQAAHGRSPEQQRSKSRSLERIRRDDPSANRFSDLDMELAGPSDDLNPKDKPWKPITGP